MKFYPYKEGGGGGKSVSHAARGGGVETSFGVLEVLAILRCRTQKVSTQKFYPFLRGEKKVLDPKFSHFVAPIP